MDTILLTREGAVATITLNRPESMNAYNAQMARDLDAALEDVAHDDAIRVCVLRGAGPCFSAGGDVHYFHEQLEQMSDEVASVIIHLERAIQNIITMSKPVIAVAHGTVAGVGMSLLAAADLVLMTDDCVSTMAYSKLGVTPDGAATFLLPRVIGHKKAMEWMLLSDKISAQAALDAGLVNWLVSQDNLESTLSELTKRLSHGAQSAYGSLKQLMHSSWENTLAQQLQAEAKSFSQLTQSAYFKEAVTAFAARSRS